MRGRTFLIGVYTNVFNQNKTDTTGKAMSVRFFIFNVFCFEIFELSAYLEVVHEGLEFFAR